MSRTARAIEILEAINQFFQEHDGQVVLYSDSQILDSEISIKDAIAECLGQNDDLPEIVIPRSQRRHIWKNNQGIWNGYIGKRRVRQFGSDYEAAQSWLHEVPSGERR